MTKVKDIFGYLSTNVRHDNLLKEGSIKTKNLLKTVKGDRRQNERVNRHHIRELRCENEK